MSTDDLQDIEVRLGRSLPDDYRDFLAAYPDDAPDDLRRFGLFADAASIVEQTLIFRRYLIEETDCDRFVVIGDSGCGDRVCVDRQSAAVFAWSHVDEEFVLLANSVPEYYQLAVAEV